MSCSSRFLARLANHSYIIPIGELGYSMPEKIEAACSKSPVNCLTSPVTPVGGLVSKLLSPSVLMFFLKNEGTSCAGHLYVHNTDLQ